MLNLILRIIERRRKKKRVRKIEEIFGQNYEDMDELIKRLSEL